MCGPAKKLRILLILLSLCLASIACGIWGQTQPQPEMLPEADASQPLAIAPEEVEAVIIEEPVVEEVAIQAESEPIQGEAVDVALGLTRQHPIPLGTLVSVPNWDIQVVEFLRGEAAAALVNSGNRQFDPPPAGYEYALAKIFLRCTDLEPRAHSLYVDELYITGSSHIGFWDLMDGWPAPEFLYEDMYTAEAVEGWIDGLVPLTETNMMVVLDLEAFNEPRITRFFELEPGASIVPSGEMFGQTPNDLGISRDQPASIGDKVVMAEWDITILDALRGEEALAALTKDSPNYQGPEEGDEYLLIKMIAHYFGEADLPVSFYDGYFRTEVDGNTYHGRIRYPMQSDFTWVNSIIFPGATVEGWGIVSLPEGLTNPVITFRPPAPPEGYEQASDGVRYFVID